MPYTFELLPKGSFKDHASELFDLLHENMSKIAPTGRSYSEDLADWNDSFGAAFEKREEINIVLVRSSDTLAGFFGYALKGNNFFMMEIQFKPEFQGKDGIFRKLYSFVCERLRREVKSVEAFAHKNNEKSIAVLRRMGLKITGENKNGSCYHFEGDYTHLIRWLQEAPAKR